MEVLTRCCSASIHIENLKSEALPVDRAELMFFDLSLGQAEAPSQYKQKLELASKLGYDCVVNNLEITTAFDEKLLGSRARGRPGDAIREVLAGRSITRDSSVASRQPFSLTKATLSTKDVPLTSTLTPGGPLRRSFDLLAIQPLSNAVLEEACINLDVDLIYFDLSKPLPVKLVLRDLAVAVRRGIYFEIDYSAAIRGSVESRISFFAASQMVCKALRGRNIVISSYAKNAFELRGPQDVISLASLLGLRQSDAKAAISGRCKAVLEHALISGMGKSSYSSKSLKMPGQQTVQDSTEPDLKLGTADVSEPP